MVLYDSEEKEFYESPDAFMSKHGRRVPTKAYLLEGIQDDVT
jgi:hypothetical protein